MAKKSSTPKRHADHVTETVVVTDRITRTYAKRLTEHRITADGKPVATAHCVSLPLDVWSVCTGSGEWDENPDGRKFLKLAQSEAEAIAFLEKVAAAAIA